MFNISARANFGGGLIKIQTFETESLSIVNPALLPKPDATIFSAKNRDVLQPSKERQELDTAIYDALGLTPGECQAVPAGVTELVNNRKPRARSAAGRGP